MELPSEDKQFVKVHLLLVGETANVCKGVYWSEKNKKLLAHSETMAVAALCCGDVFIQQGLRIN